MMTEVRPSGRSGATPALPTGSHYFVPGAEFETVSAALRGPSAAVIVDLEDMTPPEMKQLARDVATRAIDESRGTNGEQCVLIRVNHPSTVEFDADIALAREVSLDGIVVPKADATACEQVYTQTGLPVVAVLETASAVRECRTLASLEGVVGLVLGVRDLAVDLGTSHPMPRQLRDHLRAALVLELAGTRSLALDGPSHGSKVEMETDANLAKALGMAGKACVSREEVEIVNRVYGKRRREEGG